MQYEFHIIDVKDADALVINYKANDNDRWWTAVIDAGNVDDSEKVKDLIRHIETGRYIIDYAFCTHPDKDHKGGFFNLLTDNKVDIREFCLLRPDDAVRKDFRRLNYDPKELQKAAKDLYNHPNDGTRNLIDEIGYYSHHYNLIIGQDVVGMPIKMVGPHDDYFTTAAFEMVDNFAELEDESPFENYAPDELPTDKEAKSVMDEKKEESATNKSSMILLFHPQGRNFLLAGDSCSASIHQAIDDYPELVGCTLKVPHHGSKRNLTTEVIDLLKPCQSVISCKGTKKHPNSAVVHFLSKYGDVFSTSKSGTLTYYYPSRGGGAIPLRPKQ